MEPCKKYVTCIVTFFIPFTSASHCQFNSVTFPVLFPKNNKLFNERKEYFLYMWLLQCITFYRRRSKITSLDTIAFLDTHVCINNLY